MRKLVQSVVLPVLLVVFSGTKIDSPCRAAEVGDVEIVRRPGRSYDVERHWVRVTGRALTADGASVGGATIYVTNANSTWLGNGDDVLGTAVTDAEGRFQVEPVGLTIDDHPATRSPIPKPKQAWFEVIAVSLEQGWTWREKLAYRPVERPEETDPLDTDVEQTAAAIYRGEPIDLTLTFSKPMRLHGRVTDDVGRPLSGAKVQVGRVDSRSSYSWRCQYVGEPDRDGISAVAHLPAETCEAITDQNGQWALPPVRSDSVYLFRIDPGELYAPFNPVIKTGKGKTRGRFHTVAPDGRIDHSFIGPRSLTVQVRRTDTDRPTAGVTVRAIGERTLRGRNSAVTDEQGHATLQLRPGEYTLALEPAPGLDLLYGREEGIVVRDTAKTIAVPIAAAAEVEFSAVDAQTGEPIRGVRFGHHSFAGDVRIAVQSQTVYIDNPTTGGDGTLRVILTPGRRQFNVLSAPPEYDTDVEPSDPFELAAGDRQQVTFQLKKKNPPEMRPTPIGEQLSESARRQAETTQHWLTRFTGVVRGRRIFKSSDAEAAPVIEALNRLALHEVPDLKAVLNQLELPDLQDVSPFVCTIGHDQLRNEGSWTAVRNLNEAIRLDPRNGQVSLYRRDDFRYGMYSLHDLYRPLPLTMAVTEDPSNLEVHVPVERADGRVKIQSKNESGSYRVSAVFDEETGFLFTRDFQLKTNGRWSWHFAPAEVADGILLPELSVHLRTREGKITSVELVRRESIEPMDGLPADAFSVAVPAGTTLVDHRHHKPGTPGRPPVSRIPYAVDDVLAYANRKGLPRRWTPPRVKYGDPAPPLDVNTWVDASGEIAPPNVDRKVVLVNFWGIDCGFCLHELPDVRAAAKHWADTDVAIVTVHDDNFTPEQVSQFAAENKLDFPIAVDNKATEKGWWGATTQAYGIRGIPEAIVIDRDGKLQYLGDFERALEKAIRLVDAD